MLAHKVDDDQPANYSDLILAVQKLERQSKAKDLLLPKAITTRGLYITYSWIPVNLFPSQKLKGNQTFTAPSATVEGSKVGEDLDAKPE